MKQILKEHRLDFIARCRTIQKFNIAGTGTMGYGKPNVHEMFLKKNKKLYKCLPLEI